MKDDPTTRWQSMSAEDFEILMDNYFVNIGQQIAPEEVDLTTITSSLWHLLAEHVTHSGSAEETQALLKLQVLFYRKKRGGMWFEEEDDIVSETPSNDPVQ